jgi:coatomer subunit beta
MTSAIDKNCTFLIANEKSGSVLQDEICKDLESSEVASKVRAVKNAILALLAGESMPRVLMTVIRFCITQDDHQLKKLLMLYWEVVPKYSADGKLLPEMILVCNALRNDLISPNEFIRGCMLRFLCKIKEHELLEPLIPSIKQALEHRHSYVRRNAALAVYSITKNFGDQLLPDGAELMEKFISAETDVSARRNAFLMLFNEAETIAVDFLSEHIDDISTFGDGFALLVLELSRKVCRRDPAQKSRFVRCLFQLLQSESQAVSYESAWTLVSLSTAPTAVRACAQTYTTLLSASNDNNVKLIVLDRLSELKKHHGKIVQEILMDIMRALSSPNIHICKKTLTLAIDLVGPRNIEEVMQLLKREVIRVQETELEHGEEYKSLLISTIHKCATKFAEVADSVLLVLLDFLGGDGGYNVLVCVKSIMEQYPKFRSIIVRKIIDNLDEVSTTEALRVALWILGDYSGSIDVATGEPMLGDAFDAIRGLLGDPPFSSAKETEGDEKPAEEVFKTKNVVLSDGTYASVTSLETTGADKGDTDVPHLRRLVAGGDILLGTVTCASLTKIALSTPSDVNKFVMGALLTIAGVGRLAEAKRGSRMGVFADCLDRLTQFCRVLLDPALQSKLKPILLGACQEAYNALVSSQKAIKNKANEEEKKGRASNPDDLIQFRQLRVQSVQGGIEVDLMDADDISRAIGSGQVEDAAKLRHVYQLTGFSDPVYAEASVTVHDYDIILEITIINRTPNTLTNLTVELATMGDLKIVERPQSYTIGPLDERKLRTNIKVSSTETGHIFGTIVFDQSSSAQKTFVSLNDIQLDIMDYIRPAEIKSADFRSMWAEFEWENKVAINTNILDLQEFLSHIITNTNMSCLSSLGESSATLECSNFLAANLYARSVFGEDALANVSVEKKDDADGKLSGYIRIRSKTQGIALSLGDRITSVQRAAQVAPVAE